MSFLLNPWEDSQRTRPRVRSMKERSPNYPTTSSLDPPISFPEPDFTPSISSLYISSRNLRHRHSAGDLGSQFQISVSHHEDYGEPSDQGNPKSRNEDREKSSSPRSESDLVDLLSRFQNGKLDDQDQEWHMLVSTEAQVALGKQEVRRQSIMFEIIKGERDYVADLELVQTLFIDGLWAADPQIMSADDLSGFVHDVFGNMKEIFSLHQQLLHALFERQCEQHPVLQTVADIVLDKVIRNEFRSAYETYIKHYPLAESRHRKELKRNNAYERLCQSIYNDPRVRKRDLITFLSRPVTRLPRLGLLLEETLKSTEKNYEHPDLETLPLILNILHDCVKSTQPGIEVAESKVKFWSLCERLVYQKGEIIDLDLYDQSRTLVHSGPVTRRIRSESGFHEWDDLVASLLDNYLLLTREEQQQNSSSVKRRIISRPLYLSFLQLGNFDDVPDVRKVKSEGGLLETLRSHSAPIFPFTIFHSSSRSTRRYTLYVASEAQRQKWKTSLSEAIALHRLREDSNKWFDPQNISCSYFRVPTQLEAPPQALRITGRISSVVPFTYGNRKFLVVGCPAGIFVSVRGHEDFKQVLHCPDPRYMSAIGETIRGIFNRLIVHTESAVVSYPLELLARRASGKTEFEMVDASKETISSSESNITFCKCIQIGGRALVIYASKRRLGTSHTLQVMEAIDQAEIENMNNKGKNLSFKLLGGPGFIPRDAFDVVALTKNIAICTQDGIVICDPTNLTKSPVTIIPDFRDVMSNTPMSALKERLRDARPLGLARVDADELLLIYDWIGCYVTKRGIPSRSSDYIRWETQASGFAHRGNHILLVSSQFIEVRNINTGQIAQVIEDVDIRLMYSGYRYMAGDRDDRVLVAIRGNQKEDSIAERVVELVETVEYVSHSAVSNIPDIWDEWDM
ncbi:hypothetical protein Ac2012v2_002380 [Leucoagaricus gongylophorus]